MWKLPVIFFCENNLYGEGTAIARCTAVTDVVLRAQGYDFVGVMVDGNDVLAVYEAVLEAAARARAGEGPTLIEAKTYRVRRPLRG